MMRSTVSSSSFMGESSAFRAKMQIWLAMVAAGQGGNGLKDNCGVV
jgi:hypothetical protein